MQGVSLTVNPRELRQGRNGSQSDSVNEYATNVGTWDSTQLETTYAKRKKKYY